jgi:hypothetical protein
MIALGDEIAPDRMVKLLHDVYGFVDMPASRHIQLIVPGMHGHVTFANKLANKTMIFRIMRRVSFILDLTMDNVKLELFR